MTYSQRKHIMTKKDKAALSKWANQPPRKDAGVSEKERALWDGLNQYIHERDGAITSVRHVWPIRLEVPPDSELPQRLVELGYDPIYLSEETRIGAPVSRKEGWRHDGNFSYSFVLKHVFQIALPK